MKKEELVAINLRKACSLNFNGLTRREPILKEYTLYLRNILNLVRGKRELVIQQTVSLGTILTA